MDDGRALAKLRKRSQGTLRRPAMRLSEEQRAARRRVLAAYESGELQTEETRCVCGGSEGPRVVDRDRYGLPAPSRICRGCGVVWATPRLTDESLEQFYDGDYRALYGGAATASDAFFGDQVRAGERLLDFAAGLKPGATVVDIGCGAGGMLVPFRGAGHRVAGCDLGSRYLARGREEGLDLREGEFEVLDDLAPFDLVILSHVLEHVSDPLAFLRRLEPLMAAGGLLYVELPGLQRIGLMYGDPLRYFQNAHLWNFDLGSLEGLLRLAGWQCVRGTEEIRALFTPGVSDVVGVGSSYKKSLLALADAERHRLRATLQWHGRRTVVALAPRVRALLPRRAVSNGDST